MIDLLAGGSERTHANSYYAASANRFPPQIVEANNTRFDVCIVGAGYTGLSAALFLAERGYRVGVLEANRVGWGASGRNGGQLGTGQRLSQVKLEKLLGIEKARGLWDLAEEGKALVKRLINTHQIQCDLTPGVLLVDHKKHFGAQTQAEVAHLNDRYGYDQIKYLSPSQVRTEIGTEVYYSGSLDMGAAHLHPLNFSLGLAKAAIAAGAEVIEGARVQNIVPGRLVKLHTSKAVFSAEHVIIAANGYLGNLEPHVAARVMPINSYIVATQPLDEAQARDAIRNNVAVADSKFVVNYFRLSADRRMVFGGVESYGYREPSNIAQSVRKRLLGVYPQLKRARIDYSWGGTLGITRSRLPHLARPQQNIWSASGYSGHGVGLATLCGNLMGAAIAGQTEKFDMLCNLPTSGFPGGTQLRRPLLALAMLYYSLRDRI